MTLSRLSLVLAMTVSSIAAAPEDYFKAIRANNLDVLKELAASGGVNDADGRGTTPLHYAAVYGSVESLKALLGAGASLTAQDAKGATPLILGAWSPERVILLLGAGADPKPATKAGRTALIIAAGRSGAAQAVRMLLDKGADIHAADQMGVRAMNTAAFYGDLATVELLLARGANPDQADGAGFTPLMGAVMKNDILRTRVLLARGANVNAANTFAGKVRHGNIALTNMTPLIMAAAQGSVDMVRALLAAGAKVNVKDNRGMTPLTAAVSSDNLDHNVMRALLAAGADPNAQDGNGDSVLDWARKAGQPVTLKLLLDAGAKGRTADPAPARAAARQDVRESVNLAMSLLQRSSTEFFKQSGCIGCHHQPMTARAEAAVAAAGLAVNTAGRDEQKRGEATMRPVEPALVQFIEPGGEVDTVASALAGFHASGVAPSSLTDTAVSYIAAKQESNGSWLMFGFSRAPFEESNIGRTALAVKALRNYGWPARQAEFEQRIARARAWLQKAEPRNSYERAELLGGLYWAGAPEADLKRVAGSLLREQRADGGWAQNPWMAPDAYATGLALSSLYESGRLGPADPAYQRGVEYLRRTQLEDGSWYVRSRAPKFQPYFQSGFPHDHDQWISATATAYSAMALAPAAAAAPVKAARR